MNAVNNKYHLWCLVLLPLIGLMTFMDDTSCHYLNIGNVNYVFTGLTQGIVVALSIGLKALSYYLTRGYSFMKGLVILDLVFCLLVILILDHIIFNTNTSLSMEDTAIVRARQSLVFAGWTLIQFLIFINFFVNLLIKTDKPQST